MSDAPLSVTQTTRCTPFHVMAKPAGPACNLRCSYCFYLEKKDLFGRAQGTRMSEETLEAFVREYIRSQDAPEIIFAWQGGEPTLRGLDFFRRAVQLQRRYADGRAISNALQTNGLLINDEWAEFLSTNAFLVGISVDGPPALHDAYRVDAGGRATSARVLQGLERLKAHAVEFNTLTVVSAANVKQPLKVYRYLKEIGSHFLQFIPLVERRVRGQPGTVLAGPPTGGREPGAEVTKWSVGPVAYGRFLTTVFDEWIRHDIGRTFVRDFDSTLHTCAEGRATLCVFAETCGSNVAMEHDGSVYACDHYVYPQFRIGILGEQTMAQMLDSPAQRGFGEAKRESLPAQCRKCDVLVACWGGCPKHRFLQAADGESGLNYLCAAYRHFFRHVAPHISAMASLLRQGRAPAEIMRFAHRRV